MGTAFFLFKFLITLIMMHHGQPLAERVRPTKLAQVTGQEHLTGKGMVLQKMIEKGRIPSLIFWGPPGVGKTTLANVIANEIDLPFATLSAVSAGVKEVREVIQRARSNRGTVLFIDEIHRFNKGQQDALLGAVEKGIITLIGATTENPSFEVNNALLSRCQVYMLKELSEEAQKRLVSNAHERDVYLSKREVKIEEWESLIRNAGGDGRKLLNLFELLATQEEGPVTITNQLVAQVLDKKLSNYDKNGEQHYDIISAFIKSIRGSDPNAAVYYLARMLAGGEDLKFIARRLIILASEDIGNANPTALVIANNCFQAVNVIGYPESRIILSQCVVYLASSAKSNASYLAINEAMRLVEETGDLAVPLHLRNAPTKLMKEQGYGKGYKYSHNYPNNFVDQEFMPEEIKGKLLYQPGNNARENDLKNKLSKLWKGKYGY